MSMFENAVPKNLPLYVKKICFLEIINPHPIMSPFSNFGP
jgi:hypothetical protein